MPGWIAFTLAASLAQTLRFMLQKHLKGTQLSTLGATFARFVYSAPLVALGTVIYARASAQPLPQAPPKFWAYALSGGLAQILATMCVVALFAHRNFAVGITFKKTEVMQTALLGWIVLGEGLAPLGWLAILVGLMGVLLMAETPSLAGNWRARVFTRATALGLTSGIFFAVSAVGYRGASLSLGSGDVLLRAGTTLALVTASQTCAMAIWMAWRARAEIKRVFQAWRVAALVGLTSMIGSFCWFAAFTLQTSAYVNAVGQAELIFSLLASVLFFGEKIAPREAAGIALLLTSILTLVLIL